MSVPDPTRLEFEPTGIENEAAAAAGIRPKAFRRPPHWVSPKAPETARPTPASTETLPSPRTHSLTLTEPEDEDDEYYPAQHAPHVASEPAYGIVLILVVLLVNAIIAVSLGCLGQQAEEPDTVAEATPASTTPEITLFTAPAERAPLGSPDETDAITTYFRGNSLPLEGALE